MKTPLDKDLNKVYEPFNQNHNNLRQKLTALLPDRSKQSQRAGRISHLLAFTGGTIMKNRITKLAAAAVVIIPILIGINQFGGSLDGASVAWADVVKNVEQIQTFTCRLKMDTKGMEIFGLPQKVTSIIHNSSYSGRRVDTYIDKKEVTREFWLPEKNEIIVMVPEAKVYLRKILLSEDMFDPTITQDPYTFLKEFMSFEHTKLGRKRINGIVVEGIEVDDPQLCLNTFESLTGRLWVDAKTNLPVLFEIDGSANVGEMRQTAVFDRFEWNVPLEPVLFEPDIPDDYVLLAEIKIDNKSEAMAIEGLRNFARYTGGQYPSSMVLTIAWKEILHAWQASVNWERRPLTEAERQQNQSIHSTCLFYAKLDKQDKDPAYYGNNVTAGDADAVLMRWKVSDNEYRVIYGDLTSENISAEQLAALENNPVFNSIMQRTRKTIKVQGFIGMDLSQWPTINVAPGMPAEKAGLQNGDVVIKVSGKDISQIKTPGDALKILAGPAGKILNITVKRDEQVLDFNIERVPLPK
ncbi:MAG: PDZ domain-containing protein [Planctomycetes bacterium]|nr:PDZ domain-containing protein [Planctomycetota bacterium]MBL7145899.1 PDZ domain-containing protein [Phycisphaerae bacterium]